MEHEVLRMQREEIKRGITYHRKCVTAKKKRRLPILNMSGFSLSIFKKNKGPVCCGCY
ncbi:hypothetical protein P6709_05765 [Jeotgalibacillus sp. ET6]|uniref:hypothetical protein n=1 Tax=Jeotgalibacillus sp. ET6 TaxID=3037260 RepID=UPI002418AE9B|nr:hypothetical protein [Jeotgalibacillus sp. ET6]MDG5471247.1 hypothetical protein [Jeotgalibacillus sp. ET6]